MANRVYAVTGATGNIGRRLTLILLERGHRVRAIGRSAERLRPLGDTGAEPFEGSLDNEAFLARAFEGASGAFAMIPPNPAAVDFRAYQNQVGKALASAIREAGVTHVVHLSSLGAHLPSGTGPIAGLYDNEQRLNAIEGLNVVHLRPGFFMENSFYSIGLIKGMGINGSPLDPNLPLPMIATRDIAAVAADLLDRLEFTGKSARELLGPGDITMLEVTRALGEAIGRSDLQYVQFPYEEARDAMLGMGMSQSVADGMMEMYRAINEGRLQPIESRSAENTTPTTIEEFAPEFAAAYGGGV